MQEEGEEKAEGGGDRQKGVQTAEIGWRLETDTNMLNR